MATKLHKWSLWDETDGAGGDLPGAPTDFLAEFDLGESDDAADLTPAPSAPESKEATPSIPPATEATPAPDPLATPSAAPTPAQPAEPAALTSVPSIPATPPVQAAELTAPPATPPAPTQPTAEEVTSALESQYAIAEEDVPALLTEPEKVLPKLAAQLHMQIVDQLRGEIQRNLPNLVQGSLESHRRETQAKSEFFGEWPGLQQYEQQVLAAGRMFRTINPTASADQAIGAIGMMVAQALGLDPNSVRKQSAVPAASTPPVPAAPPVGFRPAGAGVSTNPPATPALSVWDDLVMPDQ